MKSPAIFMQWRRDGKAATLRAEARRVLGMQHRNERPHGSGCSAVRAGLKRAHFSQIALFAAALLLLPRFTYADDCNGNGIDDVIDIAAGTSDDCNSNGIPDVCDAETGLRDGSAALYRCDENGGATVLDFSGSGNNGSNVGVTYSTDTPFPAPGNYSLEFNAKTDAITIPAGPGTNLNSFNALTLEAFIKPTDTAGLHYILWADDGPFALFLQNNMLFFSLQGSGGSASVSVAFTAVNAWTHVAGTYDGAAARLYVGGVEVGSAPAAIGTITVSPVRNIIRIGNDETADCCAPTRDFRGKIDQVLIDRRVLKDELIEHDATHTLTPGTSDDTNANGVPDECERIRGASALAADFSGPVYPPTGWSTSGLWHATSACPRSNTCDAPNWAYFGRDISCNFDNGATVSGMLISRPICIPPSAGNVTLSYCSAYAGEAGNANVSGFDWAWVEVNGQEVDDAGLAGDQLTWETRTVDLSSFAGQTITIRWRFDSRDAISNTELGWQIDNVRLTYDALPDGGSVLNVDTCSWYDTIQQAINAAASGQTLIPVPGTHFERINFNGKAITLSSSGGGDVTTLDGLGLGSVVTCDSGEGPGTVLDGFTITNGFAMHGGGMYNENSSPTVNRCRLIANRTGFNPGTATNGAGMYNRNSSPTVTKCTFENNIANHQGGDGRGGGMCNDAGSSPLVQGCLFVGNAAKGGGAMANIASSPAVLNCTFLRNFGFGGFGGMDNLSSSPTITNCTFFDNIAGAMNVSEASSVVIANSILWGNPPGEILLQRGSTLTVSSSIVQGGERAIGVGFACDQCVINWGSGNQDEDPRLTPDGHLRSDSPCIDAGDPSAAPATDRDGEPRPSGAGIDIGSDEFRDTSSDGMPDWWELEHFGILGAVAPGADTDLDGLTNLSEYERYGSNPNAQPIHVCDACAPLPPNTYGTIQAGLDAAVDGDTVLVGAGVYDGANNSDLDFNGRSIVLLANVGPSGTTIDCGGAAPALFVAKIQPTEEATLSSPFAVVQGFTIRNGADVRGGGIRAERSRLSLVDCVLEDNAAFIEGGGFYSHLGRPVFEKLDIAMNQSPAGSADAGVVDTSNVYLQGQFHIIDGTFATRSARFDGPGHIAMGPGAMLDIQGDTVIRTDIVGTGDVHVAAGQQLTLGGSATLNLSGLPDDLCEPGELPGGGPGGQVIVDGTLTVLDTARVHNTNVTVKLAEFDGSNEIQHNDIRLAEASTGFGGQFLADESSTISCNTIISEGDRYLDLDPTPCTGPNPLDCPPTPFIDNNRIHVIIKEGQLSEQGTLLELRARDYECEPGGVNPACASGPYLATVTGRFAADAAQNWVLETIEIQQDAKLNLCNRPGFRYQRDSVTPFSETVYVRRIVLHPGAVLNVGLQTIYFEEIVDENGLPLPFNPADPYAPLNPTDQRRLENVPLLGFSLAIIRMDDATAPPANEFDIRVDARELDLPQDQPCACLGTCPGGAPADPAACQEGAVTLVMNARGPGDGIMEMQTLTAHSVAAKGAFARAGDENVVVAFEYQFVSAGTGDCAGGGAELVVYLSDHPRASRFDPGETFADRHVEVARICPPPPGTPGAVGSGQYATFYAVVACDGTQCDLDFTRGTYVELALAGPGAAVRVDNWDPQIICRFECASFDGIPGVTEADYLLLLAAYGTTLGPNDPRACLDSRVGPDHYVDLADLLAWDTFFEGFLNSCGTGNPQNEPAQAYLGSGGGSLVPSANTLLVAAKPDDPGEQTDALYTLELNGSCSLDGAPPAGGTGSRGNGRLLRGPQGEPCQLHGIAGLVRVADGQVVLPPRSDLTFGAATVYVGVTPAGGGDFSGVPISDVAFDPGDPGVIYVVPVLVSMPQQGSIPQHTYKAAAKLTLSPDPMTPANYGLVRIYGLDPWGDPNITVTPPEAAPYDVQKLREIEIDPSGQFLFVTSAQGLQFNDNDWLLMYSESTGAETRIKLNTLSSQLQSPTALLASIAQPGKLYLASSINAAIDTRLFRLTFNPGMMSLSLDGCVILPNMRQITSVSENPANAAVFAIGFQAPTFPETQTFGNFDPLFTTPMWSTIPPSTMWSMSTPATIDTNTMNCPGLALPIAATFVTMGSGGGPADLDGDGDVDLDDLSELQICRTGPAVAQNNPACQEADLDDDGDVDQDDFSIFQRCYSGVGNPPAPDCAD